MLLADVTLNPNKAQKTGLKRPKNAEKQNTQITDSENVNFKGGLATATKLPQMAVKPNLVTGVRRTSLQVLHRPKFTVAPDELKAFLDAHPDVFLGLEFTKMGDKYVSQKIDSDIAAKVAEDYADKVNEALRTAAQQAVPAPNGIKVFLTKLLTLRTKTFPFDVQHADGRIHLTTPPKNGSFFLDPNNKREFLDEINPRLHDYILENGLGEATEITLGNGKSYQLWLKTEKAENVDASPFDIVAKSLKGIIFRKKD